METRYFEDKEVLRELEDLLKEFSNSMEYVKVNREDGAKHIYKLKNGSNEIFQDIIFKVHRAIGDRLPDDYIYEEIANDIDYLESIIEASNNLDDLRESLLESLDPDIYIGDLQEWASYHLDNQYYIDEAIQSFEPDTYFGCLASGQYLFKQDVANALLDYLLDIVEYKLQEKTA